MIHVIDQVNRRDAWLCLLLVLGPSPICLAAGEIFLLGQETLKAFGICPVTVLFNSAAQTLQIRLHGSDNCLSPLDSLWRPLEADESSDTSLPR